MYLLEILIIVSLFLKSSYEACYDYVNEQQRITPSTYGYKKYFGNSVVISNGYLIVGSKYDSENGFNAGAAHIYNNIDGKWIHQTKLLPSTAKAYAECGSTLAADGNTLLIGCPRDTSNGVNSGSIYIFKLDNSTWVETHVLKPSDGKTNAYFGKNLAIHKTTIVVNSNIDVVGLAYVYKLKSGKWQERRKLEYATNTFGLVPYSHAVAIYGNYIVVGRWYDNKNGHQSGSALVFTKTGGKWTLEGELRPSDGTHADWFGMSVAISNRFVVVSSHGDDVNGSDGSGSAYVFENVQGTWVESWKLTPRTSTAGDSFGYPLVISDDTIVVGAIGHDSESYNSGGCFVFQRSSEGNWTEGYKLLPSDGEYNGMFGYSIALEDDILAVSSVSHEDKTGSVYIFKTLNGTTALCDEEVVINDEVDYLLVVYILLPVVVVVIVVVVIVVWLCRGRGPVVVDNGEEEEEEEFITNQDNVPKQTEIT